MALPIPQRLFSEEEYLNFERQAFERSEYINGVIYQIAGESPNHGRISANLVAMIVSHLRGKPCEAFTKDMKVRSGPLPLQPRLTKGLYSYPDIVVVCGRLQFLDEHRDVLVNPTVIIEVLSDSTEVFDRKHKFIRYQTHLPMLQDYMLVWQERPVMEIYHRESATHDEWRYTRVSEITGSIRIPAIDCTLKLSEVYDRVEFPPPDEGEVIDSE